MRQDTCRSAEAAGRQRRSAGHLAELEASRHGAQFGGAQAVGHPAVPPLPAWRRAGIADNPATAIESPRAARPLPKMISEDDVIAARRQRPRRRRGKAEAKSAAQGRGACCACSNCSMRQGSACRSSSASRCRRRRPNRSSSWSRARAGASGWCRCPARRAPPLQGLSGHACQDAMAADRSGCFRLIGAAGHLTRQHFALELKALAPRGGPRCRQGLAPRAAPWLRQPPAGRRRRSPRRAADAGPCGHFDDTNLYPCAGRPAARGGGDPPPARQEKLTSRVARRPVSAPDT